MLATRAISQTATIRMTSSIWRPLFMNGTQQHEGRCPSKRTAPLPDGCGVLARTAPPSRRLVTTTCRHGRRHGPAPSPDGSGPRRWPVTAARWLATTHDPERPESATTLLRVGERDAQGGATGWSAAPSDPDLGGVGDRSLQTGSEDPTARTRGPRTDLPGRAGLVGYTFSLARWLDRKRMRTGRESPTSNVRPMSGWAMDCGLA